MLEKLPFYGQVLVFAALGLGIVVIAYFVFPNLQDMQAEIDTMSDDLAEKQREVSDGQAIEARLPEFEREIASLEQKLGDVQQILPTGRETGDLLRWIKNLGDQSNLDLKSFAPGGLRPVEFYKEFPIEMNVVGTYHDLGLFLDRVSKYQRIINVDNLRMSKAARNTPGRTIQASFTATTFVYDEEGAGAEALQ
jgi:type IV pilus assembly protein PilO